MDPFLNGTGKTGTGQVSFTRKNLSEPFHFLSEPFHFFRSCKRAFSCDHIDLGEMIDIGKQPFKALRYQKS